MEKMKGPPIPFRLQGFDKVVNYLHRPRNAEHVNRLQAGSNAHILLNFALLQELIAEYGQHATIKDVLNREAASRKQPSPILPAGQSPEMSGD